MRRVKLKDNWQLKRFCGTDTFDIEKLDEVLKLGNAPKDQLFEIEKMPSQVHDVLFENDVLVNPNITGINTEHWVGESDWIYICRFKMDKPKGVWTLWMDGLDTFADVYLNGKLIASNNDAYLPCKAENISLQESNILVLYFNSSMKVGESVEIPEKYGDLVQVHGGYIRTRRNQYAQCNGPLPYMIRSGVYGDIWLEQAETLGIEEMSVKVSLNSTLDKGTVLIDGTYVGDSLKPRILAELFDSEGKLTARKECRELCSFAFDVENPVLWWPRTHGAPTVYKLVVSAFDGDVLQDRTERVIGFRRAEVVGNMEIYVNNCRTRLWGADFVNMDSATGCYNSEKANLLLDYAELGNFNCLRIWGEGEILSNEFYDECDRRGILLWQDFFLGYTMYSEEPEFTALVKREAEHTVLRLRHHPSILLWCGGNEMIMHKEYEHADSYAWGQDLYQKVFPEVCQRLDPDRYYHICSPSGGRFNNDPFTGDTHGLTHVWYIPGGLYPAFQTENNRICMPPMRTLRRMMTPEELWPEGYHGNTTKENRLPWPQTWDEHNFLGGCCRIGKVEEFYDADDAESLAYRVGMAGAMYFKQCIERYRQGRPFWEKEGDRRVNGHLVWRFNSCSNVISFTLIDYFGEPTSAFYKVKDAYSPLLASFTVDNEIILWLTNDTPDTVKGKVVVSLFSIEDNKYTNEMTFPFMISPDDAVVLGDLDVFLQFRRYHVLVAQVYDDAGKLISRNIDYVDIERHIAFPTDAHISMRFENGELVLTTDKFARCVELIGNEDGDEFGWLFDDNYFDLLPGEEKRVKIRGRHSNGKITAKPYYSEFTSSLDWNR